MRNLEGQVPVERLEWFIHLRWWAVGVGLFIVFLAPALESVQYQPVRLVVVLAVLAGMNGLYRSVWSGVRASERDPAVLAQRARNHIHVQMLGDLFLLTLLLAWSGGIENPLVLLYLFHLAIGSMALPKEESRSYVLLITALPWVLWMMEDLGWVRPLWGVETHLGTSVQQAFLLVFSVTTFGLWMFLTRLTGDLLDKEAALRVTGRQLQEANEGLLRLDEHKNRFFRQVAHDLKNPLAAASSCLEAAEVTLPEGRSQATLDMMGRAKVRLGGLAELVDDLIWLSQAKTATQPFRPEALDPYALAQRAIQAVEARARAKSLTIRVQGEAGAELWADPRAFQRVLENLLANAVKYTPAGKGVVEIVLDNLGDFIVLTVSDPGIGIPEEEQTGLFEEFVRASNAKAQGEPGTGLGLAIVKQIVDWHGGKVKLSSRTGEGTRVETWWPNRAPGTQKGGAAEAPPGDRTLRRT